MVSYNVRKRNIAETIITNQLKPPSIEKRRGCKKRAKKGKKNHQVHKHIKHLIFSREFSKPDTNSTQFTQHGHANAPLKSSKYQANGSILHFIPKKDVGPNKETEDPSTRS